MPLPSKKLLLNCARIFLLVMVGNFLSIANRWQNQTNGDILQAARMVSCSVMAQAEQYFVPGTSECNTPCTATAQAGFSTSTDSNCQKVRASCTSCQEPLPCQATADCSEQTYEKSKGSTPGTSGAVSCASAGYRKTAQALLLTLMWRMLATGTR